MGFSELQASLIADGNFRMLTTDEGVKLTSLQRNTAISAMGTSMAAFHSDKSESGTSRRVYVNDYGVVVDSLNGDTGNGVYTAFHAIDGDTTIEAVLSMAQGYSGTAADPHFADNGYQHVGVGLKWSDSSNFAVVAMISSTSGRCQISDKASGTEHYIYDNLPSSPITLNQKVRIKVTIASGTVTVTWTDYTTGVQIDTYSYTVTAGTPSTGKPFFHVNSAVMNIFDCRVSDTTNGVLVQASNVWGGVHNGISTGGLRVTNGSIVLYSDGTNGSVNGDNLWLCPIKFKNATIRGTINITSGRLWGIAVRQEANGNSGYIFFYDNNTPKFAIRPGRIGNTSDIKSWTVSALSTGVDYPFELIIKDDMISLRFNGTTYAWVDSTIQSSGYFGLSGYTGVFTIKDVVIYPMD